MAEGASDATESFGLDDAALAVQPTVYASGALDGQVVLISGGAGGIGRAAAWLFARLGAHVVIAGRSADKIDALVAAIGAQGLKASGHAVDIRDPDSVAALFERVWSEQGRLDILVNSAGGQFPQAAIDFSVKGWNAVINTNLNGTWFMMQAAAQRWRDAKQPGSIVNIVVVTTRGLYGVAHSVAARAGVIGLSRSVAVEWAPLGIRINCIAPGAVETEGWKVYTPEARAAYPRSNPMLRAGSAWEIAEACVYLGGPAAKFVTGELLTVDGGGQLWGETWTTGKPDYFKETLWRSMRGVFDPFDVESVRQKLAGFIAAQGLGDVSVGPLRRYTVGFSWVTYGFHATWRDGTALVERDLILRAGPPNGIFAPYKASPEFLTLGALARKRRAGARGLLVRRQRRRARRAVLRLRPRAGRGADPVDA